MDLTVSIHVGGRDPFGRVHGPAAGGIIIGIVKFEMNDTLQHLIWDPQSEMGLGRKRNRLDRCGAGRYRSLVAGP